MKVSKCKQCNHYKRRVWAQYYTPANYHPIGFSHAYAFCTKHKCRCLEVKKCEDFLKNKGSESVVI